MVKNRYLSAIITVIIILTGAEGSNAVSESVDIYVVSHSWHTGIVISTDDWLQAGGVFSEKFPKSEYLEFGWGDARFYPKESFSFWLAIRAILWPTSSVMHVAGFPETPAEMFPSQRVTAISLDRENLNKLVESISSEFVLENDEPVYKTDGRYFGGQFFEAKQWYHMFRTSNVWTAGNLKKAGVNIRVWCSVTESSVHRQLR